MSKTKTVQVTLRFASYVDGEWFDRAIPVNAKDIHGPFCVHANTDGLPVGYRVSYIGTGRYRGRTVPPYFLCKSDAETVARSAARCWRGWWAGRGQKQRRSAWFRRVLAPMLKNGAAIMPGRLTVMPERPSASEGKR